MPRHLARRSAVMGAAAAALAAVSLAACATVPTSGPIREGRELRLEREDVAVPFIATPPQPGASAEDVVRGFLRAGADFRNDHFVARLHLAPRVRQRWRTGASTTVYDRADAPLAVEQAAATVSVHGSEVARIAADGSYRRTSPGTDVARSFTMAVVDGEWRIASLEDGLLLSLVDVQESYRQVSLYFLAPSLDTLVPDTVLLPELPGLSTKLVTRLLRGPTATLRGAVGTAFPQGTQLEVQSVPVNDGLATVRLDETALRANADARERMTAQIVWTLKQLGPEVDRVRITAGGENLVVAGGREEQPRESSLGFDPNGLSGTPSVYVERAGAIGRILDGSFGPVPGPAGAGQHDLRSPAVSLDEARLAAVSTDGKSLYVGRLSADAPFERVASGGDLDRPSWDPAGNLWFLDRSTGALSVLPAGASEPVPVEAGKLPGGRPSRLAVSRDGARIALVTGTGKAARLLVATLSGAEQLEVSVPAARVSVLAAREVLPDLRRVRDVAWVDAQTLAVLGSRGGFPVEPLYTTTDGYDVEPVPAETDLVSLAAAPQLRPQSNPLVVATADGQLQQFTPGRGWVLLGEGTDPAYPG